MPNIITHDLFCEKVYEQLDISIQELIKPNYKEYRIGTNGPDFMFFHHLFKEGESRIAIIGDVFHDGHVNDFYMKAIEACRKAPSDIKDKMITYVIGHFLHWQLDSQMHPYVVYRTGWSLDKYKYNHYRFESMMDTMFLKHYKNQTTKDIKTYTYCNHDELSVKAISNVYIPCANYCLEETIEANDIKDALDDWQSIQKLLYDPYMIKYRMVKIYETLANKPWNKTGNVVPNKVDNTYDVLNLKHTEWKHPCTGEVFTSSAIEIFEHAIQLALEHLPLLLNAIYENDIEPLLKVIDNKTYSNGIQPSYKRKYEDIIYK